MSKIQIIILFIGIIVASCIKREEFPIVPYIEFKNFYLVKDPVTGNETGVFAITFTDGDGDIGLSAKDTLHPFHPSGDFYFNFFMTFYQEISGNMEKIDAPYNSRIPPVNPDDYPQNLKGEIQIEFDISILRTVLESNKIQIEAYIYDRALHKSNVIVSPIFQLPAP
jgi:hypothetical protein